MKRSIIVFLVLISMFALQSCSSSSSSSKQYKSNKFTINTVEDELGISKVNAVVRAQDSNELLILTAKDNVANDLKIVFPEYKPSKSEVEFKHKTGLQAFNMNIQKANNEYILQNNMPGGILKEMLSMDKIIVRVYTSNGTKVLKFCGHQKYKQ